MELQDAIDAVNAKFKYKKDGAIDRWKVMDSSMEGDCEDYALTISYLHSGNWSKFFWRWMAGYYKMWFVTAPSGNGHAVLEVEGKFIDNFYRELVTEMPRHEFKWVCPRFILLGKLFWSLVLGLADAVRGKR